MLTVLNITKNKCRTYKNYKTVIWLFQGDQIKFYGGIKDGFEKWLEDKY